MRLGLVKSCNKLGYLRAACRLLTITKRFGIGWWRRGLSWCQHWPVAASYHAIIKSYIIQSSVGPANMTRRTGRSFSHSCMEGRWHRIGYLVMLLLSEQAGVLMLATNSLKNVLNSGNKFIADNAISVCKSLCI